MIKNIHYQFWYHYYKAASKLGLWRFYHGVDEETGIPFVEAHWIWQNHKGLDQLV